MQLPSANFLVGTNENEVEQGKNPASGPTVQRDFPGKKCFCSSAAIPQRNCCVGPNFRGSRRVLPAEAQSGSQDNAKSGTETAFLN